MSDRREPKPNRKACVNVSADARRLLEQIAARWTLRDGRRWTLQAVAEEAVRREAARQAEQERV